MQSLRDVNIMSNPTVTAVLIVSHSVTANKLSPLSNNIIYVQQLGDINKHVQPPNHSNTHVQPFNKSNLYVQRLNHSSKYVQPLKTSNIYVKSLSNKITHVSHAFGHLQFTTSVIYFATMDESWNEMCLIMNIVNILNGGKEWMKGEPMK